MKKLFKFLTLFLIIFIIAPLTSCGDPVYTIFQEVSVVAFDEIAVPNATVNLYKNGKFINKAQTDENGKAVIGIPDYDEYEIILSNTKQGLKPVKEYKTSVSGRDVEVNCTTSLATSQIPEKYQYYVGDVMHDISVTNPEGNTITLSNLLEGKKLVILNFWYGSCQPCHDEFPAFADAYDLYNDFLDILALDVNWYQADTNETITLTKDMYDINFEMAMDPKRNLDGYYIHNFFNVQGAPTSVIIDQYGVIGAIHEGSIQSIIDFDTLILPFIGDDYVPNLKFSADSSDDDEEEIVLTEPNCEMPSSSEIENVINGEGFNYSYYPETKAEDKQYSWPWIISEDGKSIHPSNIGVNPSWATIYTTFTIKENQVLAFDFFCSTEIYDVLYVLIDGVEITQIFGISSYWETCYAYVPLEEGEHELCLIYYKDLTNSGGEDTIYIKNMRIISTDLIDNPTYIIRECYQGKDESNNHKFITPIYNEEDGYYHVNTKNGPLVLADLLNSTLYNEYSLIDYCANGGFNNLNGKDYTSIINQYAGYANHSGIAYTPVTEELKEALEAITTKVPVINDPLEWLTTCNYFSAYGTNGKEMVDPIKGLAHFSAYEAKLGENVVNFNTTIVPRGKLSKFTPSEDGIYKIYSTKYVTGNPLVDPYLDHQTACWIYTKEGTITRTSEDTICESNFEARSFYYEDSDNDNFVLYVYLEEGEEYYICTAYDDIYRYTDLTFTIEYLGVQSYQLLTLCAPGHFSSEGVDESGNLIGDIISLAIDIELSNDGYYYEKLSNGQLGSKIYADFKLPLSYFDGTSISDILNHKIRGTSQRVGFDFRYDSFDEKTVNEVLDINGNIVEARDYTSVVEDYMNNKMIKDGSELDGLVPVDEELANILWLLVNKYSAINNVDGMWLKICYYNKTIGNNY